MSNLGQQIAQRSTTTLYWAMVALTAVIGILVVLPFYAYEIPLSGAGDRPEVDVKLYWPFGFSGTGRIVHDACIVLAFVAPMLVPATLIWSTLRYLGSTVRRASLLWPAVLAFFVMAAYAWQWRAILAWHLD